jgi:hypothetical protein
MASEKIMKMQQLILALLVVDLLWKRKKGQATASQIQTILVTHV